MSNYVGFAEIAELIRGAESNEVIELFKAVAGIVTMAHQVKGMEYEESPVIETASCLLQQCRDRMQAWQRRMFLGAQSLRPHLLSQLDVADIFEFIYTNVDKIVGDPKKTVLAQEGRNINVAEHWLIKCVIHPDNDPEGDLRRLWTPYLLKQPLYKPVEDPAERYERQVRQIEQDDSPAYFPGLVQVLRSFTSADDIDDVGITTVLQEYLRLATTAANIWMHIWQEHGVRRGQPLYDDDDHIQNALALIKVSYYDWINDWKNETPLHVRRELAKHNFGGDLLFLMNHVFPKLIAPSGSSVREDMFGWELYRYIVNAATSPEIDRDGQIANLIRLQPWYTAPSSTPRHFFQPQSIGVFMSFMNLVRQRQDVVLEAYGSCINIDDISMLLVQSPPGNAICTICQYGFGSGEEEQAPCVQLLACEDLFHCDCLENWANGVHVDDVQCPNCRAKLCKARPRRRMQD
ncbi:Nn.00g013560.m01.CDS01 [Neocucurbitaria sp. VM-36]